MATLTSTSGPPEWMLPYIQTGLSMGSNLLNQPRQYFPGSTVVPFSGQTEQALQGIENRATAGSPLQAAGNQAMMDTIGGSYLYGGDAFNAALQAAQNQITPAVQSAFGTSGRSGSGLAQTAMTQAMADSFASLYNQERGRQMNAAAMAPEYAAQDYNDLNRLANVGQIREGLSRDQLADSMERFNFAQDEPRQRLAEYMSLITGAPVGSQSSQPIYRNTASDVLGGALAGGSIGSQLPSSWLGGYGGLVGAGLGGLLGGLF